MTEQSLPTGIAMNNQVFISYRQESPEHGRAVRHLGELFKQAGLPVLLDQFYMDEHPGGPNEGWPKWCEDAATKSACVIIIGSVGWFAAYEGTEPPGKGCGAASEAGLFRQILYTQKGDNAHIRLVYLHHLSPEQVPVGLRPWHHFRPLDSDVDSESMIRWIRSRLELPDIHHPSDVRQELGSTAGDAAQLVPGNTTRTSIPFPRDLIEFLAETYPETRDARALWQRAGGRAAEVENIPRSFDLWQNLWRRSNQGAAARPEAILLAVREEYPGNALIAQYLAAYSANVK